jgi:Tfp pilus assembly protein PilV
MIYKNKSGQSLIEILIAISAITIVLVSLVAAATRSLSGSVSARTQALATKLAEEQMEKIRAYRDRNGLEKVSCLDKCFLDDSLAKIDTPQDIGLLSVWFTVDVPIDYCPSGNQQVTVISEWIDGKGTHRAKSVSCFSLWQ